MAPPANGAWHWFASDIPAYEDWLGTRIQVAALGHGKTDWSNFIPFDARDYPEWVAADLGFERVFLPHIPGVPGSEVDAVGPATALRNLANGEYNDKFRTMAQGFRDDGFTPETLVLRISNEFNITAQPYSPVDTDVTASEWVQGYRQIVDTCRDVLGADLRTVWAPLLHTTQMTPDEVRQHYPGPKYAFVGGDIYDNAPAYDNTNRAPDGIDYDTASESDRRTVQEFVWEENHLNGNKWGNNGPGLNHLAQWSSEVGRDIIIPEWGLSFDNFEWGGDVNPVFPQRMFDWMDTHDVLFHSYFEVDTPDAAHILAPDGEFDFQAGATTYQDTFGTTQPKQIFGTAETGLDEQAILARITLASTLFGAGAVVLNQRRDSQ